MARVIGETGRLAAKEASRKIKRMLLVSFFCLTSMAIIAGYSICLAFPAHIIPWRLIAAELLFFGIITQCVRGWLVRGMQRYECERLRWRHEALGKAAVASILETLPDECIVFNDLQTLSGRIDHVVVAPTGIFVIDTRNWRGTITPDGLGELLCNGVSTGLYEVKNLLVSISTLREKINVLTHREDFIQGILAFPLGRVEIPWGTTRNVHCIADERIADYIRNYSFSRPLRKREIEFVEKAFRALAGMESGLDPTDGRLTTLPARK